MQIANQWQLALQLETNEPSPVGNEKAPTSGALKGSERNSYPVLVEAAGIEPASASYPLQTLHAYTVFNLTAGNPTGRVNQQPV
jgi:hypothetical protein